MPKSLKQISVLLFLLFFSFLGAEIPEKALKKMPPMNQIYHPVSTTSEQAQNSFDRGLTYIFAYNHDIAFREFEKASQYDPQLAMAYWGMALALGQNINMDVTPANELKCYNYIQKAIQLSNNATLEEKAYISALATRYTNNPSEDLIPLRYRYRDAMKKVAGEYPEDLDAASMYAESILSLDPWKWWTPDGHPKEGTYEAIDVLESVLLRNPDHIGANHYYIHAWEESPFPQRALMSAHRLEWLLPESGHLLHMPCHIFLLVGDYESALKTNQKAIIQDKTYIKEFGFNSGEYPMHYLKHNLYIMTRIYMLMEDYDNAIKTAFEVTEFVKPHLQLQADFAMSFNIPLEIYLYFHKWQEILDYKIDSSYAPLVAYWHFSRGVALAALGEVESAKKEKTLFEETIPKIKPQDEIAKVSARKVMELAETLLNAALAEAENNPREYERLLKKGVEIQDRFDYDEPPAWYIPVSQMLGFAYLKQKKYAEAQTMFKTTLSKQQRNGRSLFGLYLSYKGQGKNVEAYWVEREMTAALKNSSGTLNLNDL